MNKQANFAAIWGEQYPPLMLEEEMNLLLWAVTQDKNRIDVAVELGTYNGGTTVRIAKILKPEARMYTVDCFALNAADVRDACIARLAPEKNIMLLEMSTDEAAQEFTLPIDFLLVDACHDDGGILSDLANWLPKVKSGGVVAFDDYFNDDYPDIRRRVEEKTAGWKDIGQAGFLLIKRKP